MKYLQFLCLPLLLLLLMSCSKKSRPGPDRTAELHAKLKGDWKYVGLKLVDRQDTRDRCKQYFLDRRVTGYYEADLTGGSVEIGDSTFKITALSYTAESTYFWYAVPGDHGISPWTVNINKYNGQTIYRMVNDSVIHFTKPLLEELYGGVEVDVPFEGESAISWSQDTLIIMTVTQKTTSYTSNDTLYERQSTASVRQQFLRK